MLIRSAPIFAKINVFKSFNNVVSIYLTDKCFRVNINIKCKYSSTAKIECGLPPESILGPLLFVLYANNMKQTVYCDLFLCAGDYSSLIYQHNDVSIVEQNLNKNFLTNLYFTTPTYILLKSDTLN